MRCEFAPLQEHGPGALCRLLEDSYGPLLGRLPDEVARGLRVEWQAFDDEVQLAPGTVGRCGFLTVIGDEPIGFGSWDPRGWPKLGRVGHNCVRSGYQRQGYGQVQMERIVAHFRSSGFALAEARTGADPFFEPARRMYLRCGFEVADRVQDVLGIGFDVLVYRMALER